MIRPCVTVVTGGAAGLGAATAKRLAAAGHSVVIADRQVELADEVAAQVTSAGGQALTCRVDVADEDAVIGLREEMQSTYGRVDALVNCAGVAMREGSVVDMARKAWDLTLAVNLTGTFLMCRHMVPLMPTGSTVINVSTSGVKKMVPNTDAYVAAKAGVVALSKAMALSLADRGIRVNVVCPGVFATDEVRSRLEDPRVVAMLARTAPLGRAYGSADEFASVVEFLCSPAASYINGAEILLDGGGSV